jgi:flagellin-like hook-associated protein FlgL
MAARDRQAEQERGALEAEIEQLMERFLRMHNERGG